MGNELFSPEILQETWEIATREIPVALWETFYVTLLSTLFAVIIGLPLGVLLVVGEKDDKVYIASEEAAIRTMEPNAENIWAPAGGEPVIVKVKDGAY